MVLRTSTKGPFEQTCGRRGSGEDDFVEPGKRPALFKMLCLRELETEPSAELKGSRAARAEYLRGPTRRLAKGRALEEVRTVPGEIRNIQEVESLSEDVHLVPFAESDDLA